MMGGVPSDGPVLDIRALEVSLGGRTVLEDVHLSMARGELLGLVGPNGAGKTTLLRTALGLIRPSGGSVRANGRAPGLDRTGIGYVPQRHDFAWDFPISVADTVATGLTRSLGLLRRPRTEHWETVADALERVRMSHLARRPIGDLSGGQRQRVLVARALALQPSLLLLDEPFTGLDMPTQELLSELFIGLAREGRAVMMTTHDLVGAVDTCDRLALLNRTVIASGPAGELSQNTAAWTTAFAISPDSAIIRALQAV